MGFPGIRLGPGDPETWCERRVVLPSGWQTIHVERLWIRGEEWSLVARDGAAAAELDRRMPPARVARAS